MPTSGASDSDVVNDVFQETDFLFPDLTPVTEGGRGGVPRDITAPEKIFQIFFPGAKKRVGAFFRGREKYLKYLFGSVRLPPQGGRGGVDGDITGVRSGQ